MYSRNSFGSYYPINSSMHKLNPVIKLINFLITLVLLILTNSFYINMFVFVLVFLMMVISFVPFRYYINTFWSLRFVYLLVAVLCLWFDTSMETCIIYIIKVISIVEYLNILAFTTSPSESVYGIEKFLSFFNILYLPLSKLAIKINALLRYIPNMLGVEYKILKASSSRGIDYQNSNMIGRFTTLCKLYSNKRRLLNYKNEEIKFSQELRMFDLKKYRTNYRTNRMSFLDLFFLLFHLLLVYVYLIEGGII